MIDINRAARDAVGVKERKRAAGGKGEGAPGKVVVISVEAHAQIAAVDLELLAAEQQMKLGVACVPFAGSALVEKIAADEKSITHSADPCARRADADVIEIIVCGIRNERAVFGV